MSVEDRKVPTEDIKRDYDEVEYVHEANAATRKEHELTLARALKAYPKAIMWSILLSTAVVMEGYDTVSNHHFLKIDIPKIELQLTSYRY